MLPFFAWHFMKQKRGLLLRLIVGIICSCVTSTALADVYQWYDGDGNGSLWLSDSVVEPYADLHSQVLWWANLPFANLHHANLVSTNFSFANLQNANLSMADLSHANLFDANLTNTDLAYTIFAGATLSSSDIEDANLFYADLTDADLSNMENWDSAFWLAARYNEHTIFPDGMDPDEYGLIDMEVPAPATGFIAACLCFVRKRRR